MVADREGVTILRNFVPEILEYQSALEEGWEVGTEEWVREEGARLGCQRDDLDEKRGTEALKALQKCYKRADTKQKLAPPEARFLDRFSDQVKAFMHNTRFAKAASLLLDLPVRIYDNGIIRRDGSDDLLNMSRNMTMTRYNMATTERHTVTIMCPLKKTTAGGPFFFPGTQRPQSYLRSFEVPYFAAVTNTVNVNEEKKKNGGKSGDLKLKRALEVRAKFASWGEFPMSEESTNIMNAWCAKEYDPKKKKFRYKYLEHPSNCLNSDVAEAERLKVKGELKTKVLEADASCVSAYWGWSGGPKRYDLEQGDCVAIHGGTRRGWIPEGEGAGHQDFLEVTYVHTDALKIPNKVWEYMKSGADVASRFYASLWMEDVGDGMPLEHELHPQLWPAKAAGDAEL